ncbi:MAG: hypothetical protein HC930_16485 [Hydrococcus sp. SU_1_0]|nr:hypothetical protein [Hydrococcus sp. SU_1_0]
MSSDLIITDSESAANLDSNQAASLANLAIRLRLRFAIATSRGKIIPARGIVKTKDGQIILTATPTATTATGDVSRLLRGLNNCN